MILTNTSPKIVYNSTDYLFEKSITEYEFNDIKAIENETYNNGKVDYEVLGAHVNATIKLNLFKYGASKITKFNEVITLLQKDVLLYPNNLPLKNAAGSNVTFHVSEVKIESEDELNEFDYLVVKLKSTNYVDITKLIA